MTHEARKRSQVGPLPPRTRNGGCGGEYDREAGDEHPGSPGCQGPSQDEGQGYRDPAYHEHALRPTRAEADDGSPRRPSGDGKYHVEPEDSPRSMDSHPQLRD